MISVVIPTHNAAATLPATFRSLFEATIEGLVSEVIVADCGSTDATLRIADAAGATAVKASAGQELQAGAQAARKPWLLFLKAGSSMEPGWEDEARAFIAKGGDSAAAFRLRLAGKGLGPRVREALATISTHAFGLPNSCDGLLIPAKLLDTLGARATQPVEEADLIRRLGRNHVSLLKAAVIARPERA
jgi:glycosyltransferase involved in cell wall biosynthesis